MYWIGIDCGEHTGLAVWDSIERRLLKVETMPLHRAFGVVTVLWNLHPQNIRVVFEDARKRKYIPSERNVAEYRGKLMGAGAVKRDAKIWEEFLTDYDIPFIAQAPRAGLTKWNADYFARVTGWQGRTSEHSRDAALLVLNR